MQVKSSPVSAACIRYPVQGHSSTVPRTKLQASIARHPAAKELENSRTVKHERAFSCRSLRTSRDCSLLVEILFLFTRTKASSACSFPADQFSRVNSHLTWHSAAPYPSHRYAEKGWTPQTKGKERRVPISVCCVIIESMIGLLPSPTDLACLVTRHSNSWLKVFHS